MARILALEPYYAGSHKAFLDGWVARSHHDWTVLGLPGYKWKWRMRHAAVSFALELYQRVQAGERWDAIFCSSMLNLAEFRGLAPNEVRDLPAILYFHENQLTYPVRDERERDLHFAYTHFTSALTAERLWFNSTFHQDEFLNAMSAWLQRMPDFSHADLIPSLAQKSSVASPGIELFPERGYRFLGPLRILWAARWEHDKDPESFFKAIAFLKREGVDFRLFVLGESFGTMPPVFKEAAKQLANHIDRWGYQESREAYASVLLQADVVVSTAQHEFFGIGMLEAVAAGAYPVLPRRLSYPHVFASTPEIPTDDFFYDGTVDGLVQRLRELAKRQAQECLWSDDDPLRGRRLAEQYAWEHRAPALDEALDNELLAQHQVSN